MKQNILPVLAAVALLLSSCGGEPGALEKEEAVLLQLSEFESSLSTAIIEGSVSNLMNLYSTNIENPSELSKMSFVLENSPSYIMHSFADKGVFYNKIFLDLPGSAASVVSPSHSHDVQYQMRKYKSNYMAGIRYGSYKEDVYLVEFVALYQDGKWRLITVNLGV